MPIDFKQVAAPSFSDSNTLVALAAKQQEEAMTGIQDTWTGAMKAVQNNVQGEIQGHINQATYADLINPETRAIVDNKVRELNDKYMGMGDLNALNTYTDSRVGTQQAREVSNVALEDARSLYKSEVETRDRESRNAAETSHLSNGSLLITDLNNQIQEAIAAGKTPQEVDILRERRDRTFNEYGSTPLLQAKLSDGITKLQQTNQQASLGIDRTIVGIEGAKATIDSVKAGTEGKQVNTAKVLAQLDALPTQEKAKQRTAIYAKGGLEGAVDPTTGGTLWDVVNNRLTGVMSTAADAANDPMSSDESYADYLVKSREGLEKIGLKSQEIDSLNEVFREYDAQGIGFSDGEKKAIINGFASGTLKKNRFYDFTNKVRKGYLTRGIKEGFANEAVNANKEALTQGVRKSVEPVLQSLLDGGNSPQEIVMQLGWKLDDERWQHMPSYLQQAVGWVKSDNANTDRPTPYKSNDQLQQEQDERLNISSNLNNITSGTSAANNGVMQNPAQSSQPSPVRPDNMAAYTPPPVSSSNSSKGNKSDAGSAGKEFNYTMPGGRKITAVRMTPSDYIASGYNVIGTNPRLDRSRKGTYAYTTDGDRIQLNSPEDLGKFIQINSTDASKAKAKRGEAYLAGKLKYTPPDNTDKPDPNHPLANRNSDRLDNFVPYEDRDAWGNRKTEKKNGDKTFKYSSYETYRKSKKWKKDRTVQSK